jgi:hypothetical protein
MISRAWLSARHPRTRYGRLAAELAGVREELAEAVSALDRGVIEAGLSASRAQARADAAAVAIASAYEAEGITVPAALGDCPPALGVMADAHQAAGWPAPSLARAKSRRQRAEESGLRLMPGGAA